VEGNCARAAQIYTVSKRNPGSPKLGSTKFLAKIVEDRKKLRDNVVICEYAKRESEIFSDWRDCIA
jgi:hypothetical protein